MVPWTFHGTSINNRLVLNQADSPPLVYSSLDVIIQSCGQPLQLEQGEENCRNCQSRNLFLDCTQGDRVCHQCGHVAEGHVMVNPQQLRQYGADLKEPPEDETNFYLPFSCTTEYAYAEETSCETRQDGCSSTTLSETAFGKKSCSRRVARIRSRLRSTNQLMNDNHTAGSKVEIHGQNSENIECCNLHKTPHVMLHEEDTERTKRAAMYSDMWSLDRAILLCGSPEEVNNLRKDIETSSLSSPTYTQERNEFLTKMDDALYQAACDVYIAFSMTKRVAMSLYLPNKIMDESADRLVRYASRKNGFVVKGVHSKLSKKHGDESLKEQHELNVRLEEYNKLKQMSALVAANLYLSARNSGSAKTMEEVCSFFAPHTEMNTNETTFIKPKHITRAVEEIRTVFPEYAQGSTPTNKPDGISTFCFDGTSYKRSSIPIFPEHLLRNLYLPPVAESSVQVLFCHFREKHPTRADEHSGDVILCAALAHFVCTMGAAMQILAREVHMAVTSKRSISSRPSRKRTWESMCEKDCGDKSKEFRMHVDEECARSFKVLAMRISSRQSDKEKYERRRLWDAWEEQRPWSRTVSEIERACDVAGDLILDLYHSSLLPQKEELLTQLKDCVCGGEHETSHCLRATPLASILLSDITTVSPLMFTTIIRGLTGNTRSKPSVEEKKQCTFEIVRDHNVLDSELTRRAQGSTESGKSVDWKSNRKSEIV